MCVAYQWEGLGDDRSGVVSFASGLEGERELRLYNVQEGMCLNFDTLSATSGTRKGGGGGGQRAWGRCTLGAFEG
jgi:hypothetical protein